MGLSSGRYAADKLAVEVYERALGAGLSLDARGDLPRTAEEFAHAVVRVVFDGLAAGLHPLNQQQGWHPDDPRWDQPEPDPAPRRPRWPMIGEPTPEARSSGDWRPA